MQRTIISLISIGIPTWCSSSKGADWCRRASECCNDPRRRAYWHRKPHNRPLVLCGALSRGTECFARVDFSKVQHKVQLQEPGKRRAHRQHLMPAKLGRIGGFSKELCVSNICSASLCCDDLPRRLEHERQASCSWVDAKGTNTASYLPIPQSINENWYR